MAIAAETGLWVLITHLKRWLINLRRAGARRKRQSIEALRAVVIAARGTRVYLRELGASGRPDHARETQLAENWTRLGFVPQDLGLGKLAKRCDVTGRYWADPDAFEREFLDKADVGLARMEQLARQMVSEIEG